MCPTIAEERVRRPPAIRKQRSGATKPRRSSSPSPESSRPSSSTASRSPFSLFYNDVQRGIMRYLSCGPSESSFAASVLQKEEDREDADNDSPARASPTTADHPLSQGRSDASTAPTTSVTSDDNADDDNDDDRRNGNDLAVSTSISRDSSSIVLIYSDKSGKLRSSEDPPPETTDTMTETTKKKSAKTKTSISRTPLTIDTGNSSSTDSSPRHRSSPKRCRLIDRLKQKQLREQQFRDMLEEQVQSMVDEKLLQEERKKDHDSVSTTTSGSPRWRRMRSNQSKERREKTKELMAMNEFAGFSPKVRGGSKKKTGKTKTIHLQMFRKRSEVGDHDSVHASGASIGGYSRGSTRSRNSARSRGSVSSRRSLQTCRTGKSGGGGNGDFTPVSILRRTRSVPDNMTAASGSVRFAKGTVFVEPKTRKKVPRLNSGGGDSPSTRRKRTIRVQTPRHQQQQFSSAARCSPDRKRTLVTTTTAEPSLESALSSLFLRDTCPYSVNETGCNAIDDMVPLLEEVSSRDCYVFR